jgi:hypothetical protein
MDLYQWNPSVASPSAHSPPRKTGVFVCRRITNSPDRGPTAPRVQAATSSVLPWVSMSAALCPSSSLSTERSKAGAAGFLLFFDLVGLGLDASRRKRDRWETGGSIPASVFLGLDEFQGSKSAARPPERGRPAAGSAFRDTVGDVPRGTPRSSSTNRAGPGC